MQSHTISFLEHHLAKVEAIHQRTIARSHLAFTRGQVSRESASPLQEEVEHETTYRNKFIDYEAVQVSSSDLSNPSSESDRGIDIEFSSDDDTRPQSKADSPLLSDDRFYSSPSPEKNQRLTLSQHRALRRRARIIASDTEDEIHTTTTKCRPISPYSDSDYDTEPDDDDAVSDTSISEIADA